MPNLNRSTATHNAGTAGLILGLVDALPSPSSALARRARAIAAHGSAADAGDVLADLLNATDCGLCFEADGLLDEEWDA